MQSKTKSASGGEEKTEKERIDEMIEAIMKVARGDYSVQVKPSGKNDELDSLAVGINMMIDDIRHTLSERKKAEEKFAKANVYVKGLINSMADGFWAVSTQGKTIDANPAMAKMLGYESKTELINKNPANFTAKKDLGETARLIKKAFAEKPSTGEINLIKKDGKEFPVSITSSPMKDVEGKTIGAFAVMRDITERKKVERTLEERAKEFKCLYSVTNSIRSEKPLEKLLIDTTKYIREAWQYPEVTRARIKFDGKKYESTKFKETKFKQVENIVIKGKVRGKVEVYYIKKMPEADIGPFLKEEEKLLDEIASYLGTYIGKIETGKEIKLLSSAVEQSTEGIAVIDLKGNLLFVNNAFANMHGYSSEELAGKHLSIFHTPDQMPSVNEANQQIQKTGEFSGEIWSVRRDGTVFPTLMHNSLLRDEAGNPTGMIGALRDITERKKAEEKLIQLNKQLEAKVAEMERFSKFTIDRELKMVELKKEINELCKKLGEKFRYSIKEGEKE